MTTACRAMLMPCLQYYTHTATAKSLTTTHVSNAPPGGADRYRTLGTDPETNEFGTAQLTSCKTLAVAPLLRRRALLQLLPSELQRHYAEALALKVD